MSFNTTIDDIVYSQTTQPPNIADKPFISKSWTNPIYDTNTSSNYTSNQVIFDTTVLSNSGQLVNYQEGIIALPFVIKVSRTGAANDWTDATLKHTDFMLGLKNSHVQFLHSISINLNNVDIVQGVPLTNAYLTFIQHSELSQDDEFLNSPLTGYCKDSSSSWYYKAATGTTSVLTGDSRGVGLGNNCNFSLVGAYDSNDSSNEGLLRRQKLISKYNDEKLGLIHGNTTAGVVNTSNFNGKSIVYNIDGGKYIYYDCYLRLKDICPNLFNNLPMALGLKLKITLTLNNNVSFKFKKNVDGNFIYDYSQFSNPTSATNPIMLAASYNSIVSQTGGTWTQTAANAGENIISGNYAFKITDAASNQTLVPCGSSCLPAVDAAEYTVSLKLGSNSETGTRSQCILYVPSYIMSPKYSLEYYGDSNRYRKIYYTELEYQMINVQPNGSFNSEISSSCVRPKRLILIPILSASENYGLNPISSPFATEPATTSPCIISQFNCSIANTNIYPNDIIYSYDHFLQALNGSTGVNANLMNGLVSSRINLVDFQNNYGYIVCDLSRRTPENDTIAVSIRIRGRLQSAKAIDIHAYVEREKWVEIDVLTGELRNRG